MSYLDIGNPWTENVEYCCQCGEKTEDFTDYNGEALCGECDSLYI
jgi:hypothetical protein